MGEEACVLLGRLSAGILVLSLTIVTRVSAVTLYTPAEMFFVNGTVATLLCTFKSNEVVSSATSVNWKYTPLSGGTAQTLFYYHGGKSYPGSIPQFKDRVSWTGDINKKDGSITVANIQFVDNGTYSCEVKNPPDVDGTPSEINVRVVEQGHLPVSSSGVVAGAVIGAVLGVLLIIGIITYLVCRKRKRDKKKYNGAP